EIQEFASGKAEGFQREAVMKSAPLSPEQRQVLEQRGVLSPEEIHRLASKTRQEVGDGKAACHSDVADRGEAERIQAALQSQERLVELRRPQP
ncbi:MAG: hypothetical protein KC731_41605, partial [Myxococcales bacterium]|nr:hypothetical protein [Myxococcales bacterium]